MSFVALALAAAVLPQQVAGGDLKSQYGSRWTPEAEVYRQAAPSVVRIRLEGRLSEVTASLGGFEVSTGELWPSVSTGTGVVYSDRGLVLTNAHVVTTSAEISPENLRVRVMFSPGFGGDDGEETYAAQIVGIDPTHDLALLQIESEAKFQALPFAEANDLLIGERVIALGAPFGGSLTLSSGILSGTGRSVQISEEGGSQRIMRDLLQTDAAINEGSSGGPLLNAYGQLIGLTVSHVEDAEGIAYAIPIAQVRMALQRGLIGAGISDTSWAGLEVGPDTRGFWPRVKAIHPRGPGATAGFQLGDRIFRVNRTPISRFEQWASLMRAQVAGNTLDVDVRRGSGNVKLKLVLDEARKRDGFALFGAELDRGVYALPDPKGGPAQAIDCPQIVRVYENSPAARLGLQEGDLVLMIGVEDSRYPTGWAKIRSPSELYSLVRGPSLRTESDNIWIARSGSTFTGRLVVDDPGLLRTASVRELADGQRETSGASVEPNAASN